MKKFNYSTELRKIREQYVGESVSLRELEEDLFLAEREIEKNNDKIGRHRDFLTYMITLLTLIMTVIIATFGFMEDPPLYIVLGIIIGFFIYGFFSNINGSEENNDKRDELFEENKTLYLKIEIIKNELTNRKTREYNIKQP